MKKLRIYLDTSVISHLFAPDTPEKMADTRKLWGNAGAYEIVISTVVLDELRRCSEPKRAYLRTMLTHIGYTIVAQTAESERLSRLYIELGGLPAKCKQDAMHIAIASEYGCNVILSWNFRHIVNLRAMTAVDVVNLKEGYPLLRILTPTMLLESEE